MNKLTLLAVAALVVIGAGCDPTTAQRVAKLIVAPAEREQDPPRLSPPGVRPHEHDVLPDVAFAAEVSCPVALTLTSTDDEPFAYLVQFGPEQMPLGPTNVLEPGESTSIDLVQAVGHRAFIVVNHAGVAPGIAAFIDVVDC